MSEVLPQAPPVEHPIDAANRAVAYDEAAQAGQPPRRFARLASVSALATTLMVQGLATEYSGDPLFAAETTYDFVTDYSAPSVPQTIQDKVNRILDQPTSKEFKALLSKTYPYHWDENTYRDFSLRKAKECRLTTFDSRPYQKALKVAGTTDEAVSILNDYMSQVGISLVLHEQIDFSDLSLRVTPLNKAAIDLKKFKFGASKLFDMLELIPKEVLRFADLRQIRVVESLGEKTLYDGQQATIAGEANIVSGNIYIPIVGLYEGDYSLDAHEIGHRIDYKMNGLWGMFHDKQFGALNPPDFVYGKGDPKSPDFQYDRTDEPEDKAMKFQYMLTATDTNTLYTTAAEGYDKLKSKKYRLLLARLEQAIPGITQYLYEISGGNDIERVMVSGK